MKRPVPPGRAQLQQNRQPHSVRDKSVWVAAFRPVTESRGTAAGHGMLRPESHHINRAEIMVVWYQTRHWPVSDGQTERDTTMAMQAAWSKVRAPPASSFKAFSEVAVRGNNTGKISTGWMPIWVGDLTLACVQVCFPLPQQAFYYISFPPNSWNCWFCSSPAPRSQTTPDIPSELQPQCSRTRRNLLYLQPPREAHTATTSILGQPPPNS